MKTKQKKALKQSTKVKHKKVEETKAYMRHDLALQDLSIPARPKTSKHYEDVGFYLDAYEVKDAIVLKSLPDGVEKLWLIDGRVVLVDSIDLDYDSEGE